MAQLSINGLNKFFKNGYQAVRDFNLEVAEGEMVVFCGPSGCGKSSVLRMIAGLEDISSGQIVLGGRIQNDLPAKSRDTAMFFKNYALYPKKTVFDNLAFSLRLRNYTELDVESRVMEIAELLNLVPILQRKPKALSETQRLRVAFGRAIVLHPQIILMDEPLSALEPELRIQVQKKLLEIQKILGLTIVYLTSDAQEAMALEVPMVIMKDGVIQQIGTPVEVTEHPANAFVREYFR